MIEFLGVYKVYPGPVEALRDVTFRIDKGEFVFLVGPSGAGKSTILRLIHREERPSQGMILVNHHPLNKLRRRQVPYLRRQVGMIFQDFRLLPDRTVYDNVAFSLRVQEASPREIRRRVPETLDLVGLGHKCQVFPHHLSGGEQQRVALARALVGRPPILVADEPTGNLDPDTAGEVVRILLEVNRRGTTLLMATHAKALVDSVRRRVIAVDHGVVVRDDAEGAYDVEA